MTLKKKKINTHLFSLFSDSVISAILRALFSFSFLILLGDF